MACILVSFCNVAPGAPMLGLLDSALGTFRAIELPSALGDYYGITGLSQQGGFIYAGVQGRRNEGADSPAHIAVLSTHDLTLRHLYSCRLAQSIHSVLAAHDSLWAVSTGTDEVIQIHLDQGIPQDDERVVWSPTTDGHRADIHHLNSIAFLGGDLLVSGFGKKAGALWSTANDGFIKNTVSAETLVSGIDHPHSLMTIAGSLAYCESRTRSVHVNGRQVIRGLPGYVRGLCLLDGDLFVGAGVGRRVSISTGLVNNRDDPGELAGQCAVVRISPDGAMKRLFDLGAFGAEIYDLLAIDGANDY